MSIVKLAAEQQKSGWVQRHPILAGGIALTGGIAAADAGLNLWKARKLGGAVMRKEGLKGLKEGAIYGGILSSVEPAILHGALRKETE